MGAIDAAAILAPVSPDRPCGENLEYDADFLALGQAAQGKPERQMGDEVLAAEDPDWKEVRRLALQLLARSKDLRIAVPLCRALTHTDGLPGFAAGVDLLRGLVQQHWPGLYPILDPDEDDDPTMRVNSLLGLCDPTGMLKSLRETPLVNGRVAGSFSMRDLDVAAGRQPPPAGTTPPTVELVRAAFQETAIDRLQSTLQVVSAAKAALRELDQELANHLNSRAPDLRPLAGVLDSMDQELSARFRERGGSAPAGEPGAAASLGQSQSPAGDVAEIRSRDDVVVWLDRICEFFARTEPSSPVPILLQRARNLINKSFLDVIRDLVPDATSQAESLRGRREEST